MSYLNPESQLGYPFGFLSPFIIGTYLAIEYFSGSFPCSMATA